MNLPFKVDEGSEDFFQQKGYKEVVERAKSLYEWQIRDRRLPLREKLPEFVCKHHGIRFNSFEKFNSSLDKYLKEIDPLTVALPHVDKAIHQFREVVEKVHKCKEQVMSNQSEVEGFQS